MVFDKSNKHTTIYDSYNAELAAKYIRPINLSNFKEIYCLANEQNHDTNNLNQPNICYLNNLLPGPVTVVAQNHCQIT